MASFRFPVSNIRENRLQRSLRALNSGSVRVLPSLRQPMDVLGHLEPDASGGRSGWVLEISFLRSINAGVNPLRFKGRKNMLR